MEKITGMRQNAGQRPDVVKLSWQHEGEGQRFYFEFNTQKQICVLTTFQKC